MSNKRVMKLASRGKRLGAYCIDTAIPFVVLNIIMITSGISASRSRRFLNDPFGMYGFDYGYGYGNRNGFGYNPQISGVASVLITVSVLVLMAFLIVQLIFFSKSKTMGKAALGLQVISSNDGKPIGFWMMLFREWFVKRASTTVFMLGLIWVFIDEKNRGWHDKILDTYVIDQKESEKMNRAAKINAKASKEETEPVQITGTNIEEAYVDVDKIEESYVDVDKDVHVSMAMKKEELMDVAQKMGIETDPEMTKLQIIELVENALTEKEKK